MRNVQGKKIFGSSFVRSIAINILWVKNHDLKKEKSFLTEKHSLNETDGASVSTEAKKVKGGSREETKKTCLQRVWSEENEIAA